MKAGTQTSKDVVDELSIYAVPGRVTDPARALREAEDAERIGFSRVWLGERPDLKEAAVLCGAMAARTSSIGIASGLVIDAVRHPLMAAAFAATMQATFDGRFTLGVGRGVPSWIEGVGLRARTAGQFDEYVRAVRGLLAGERITYRDGEKMTELEFADKLRVPPPPIIYGTFANPKAVEIAGRSLDGVALQPFLTVETVADCVRTLRKEVERNGRDPEAFRIIQCIVVAPDLDEEEQLAVVNGRAVTYFQMRGYGDRIIAKNGWDPSDLADALSATELARSRGGVADLSFHRDELVEIGRCLPAEWIDRGAAVGTARECCEKLKCFLDAGVDEIWIHGSSPAENEGLVDLWRREFRTRTEIPS